MYRFAAIFKEERIYFSTQIRDNARRLFSSNVFRSLSNPLMSTFLNAFVFRETGTLFGVAVYNAGLFLFLPVAFYANGLLLRYLHIRILFAWGSILGGAACAAFVIAGPPGTLAVFLYGSLWGLGNGFYWANRNYLEFQETLFGMRQYFYSFLSSISSIINIVVPFIAGWFIVLGARFNLYSSDHAYWMIFGFSFVLLFISGRIIYHGTFESPAPVLISRLRVGSLFNARRILSFASGFTDGTMSFTPVLLVLLFLGNEGVLGSVTAAVSVATAVAMYLYGRFVKSNRQFQTVFASSILFFVSTLCLVLFPTKAGVVLHVLLLSVAGSFFAMATSPIFLSLFEEEMGADRQSRYSFVFDSELYLNIGRLMSIAIVLGIAFMVSEKAALIGGSIVIAALHLVLILCFLVRRKRMVSTIAS
jgi:YQGE family putative transporter